MRPDISVLVLAGGKSSRMGTDKANLTADTDGVTFFERACRFGLSLSDDVLAAVGTRSHRLSLPANVRPVEDTIPDLGPIGGIAAGLRAMKGNYLLVYATDMPLLSAARAEQLSDAVGAADICLFRSERGLEPLFALYGRQCLGPAEAQIAAGKRKLLDLISRMHTVTVEAENTDFLTNVNTPEELRQFRKEHSRG